MGRRSTAKKLAPGYWSPVSGQIEAGESEAQAIERECFEEVGLTVRARRKITDFDIDNGNTRLHFWLVDIVAGEAFLKNDEHSEIRWFTIDELKSTSPVFEEDIAIFEEIIANES